MAQIKVIEVVFDGTGPHHAMAMTAIGMALRDGAEGRWLGPGGAIGETGGRFAVADFDAAEAAIRAVGGPGPREILRYCERAPQG